MNMTVSPFQMNEVMHIYNRLAKLTPGAILDREQSEPQDVVRISAEAKKRQVLDQARTEVLEQIRNAK
jgi:predicted acetyltransferase